MFDFLVSPELPMNLAETVAHVCASDYQCEQEPPGL